MKLKHIDLFSGIGGFALAVDTVWPGSEHIFCDNEPFSQQILKKHWPNSKIYGDIRTIANAQGERQHTEQEANQGHAPGQERVESGQKRGDSLNGDSLIIANPQSGQDDRRKSGELAKAQQGQESGNAAAGASHKFTTDARGAEQRGLPDSPRQEIPAPWSSCDILTGGFPCQPFSAAGKRKGTEDNRYLWPEMFRIISTFKPTWVIAENVRGLVTWNDGLVLEQVCADLEGQGYEVQPLIIPAVAVNAPHRRDRIWFIAHRPSDRRKRQGQAAPDEKGYAEGSQQAGQLARGSKGSYSDAADPKRQRGGKGARQATGSGDEQAYAGHGRNSWSRNWLEVAAELCGVDDGLPAELDGFKLTKPGHRAARLKALGNAIVPQVAIEIMKAIKQTYEV